MRVLYFHKRWLFENGLHRRDIFMNQYMRFLRNKYLKKRLNLFLNYKGMRMKGISRTKLLKGWKQPLKGLTRKELCFIIPVKKLRTGFKSFSLWVFIKQGYTCKARYEIKYSLSKNGISRQWVIVTQMRLAV